MVWLRIYQLFTYMLWPIWAIWILTNYLLRKSFRTKYALCLKERLGFDWSLKSTPEGQACWWFHAVSLGETQAALSLIDRVIEQHPQDRIIFSHMTPTGLELAQKYFKDKIEHIILGPDLNFLARLRIQRARPQRLVFVESDMWPSLAWQAKRHGAKIAVVNGRLSDRSSERFSKFGFLSKIMWSFVDRCIVQSSFQKELWTKALMPAEKIYVGGFLKLDKPDPVLDSTTLENLKKIWLSEPSSFTYFLTLSCTHAPEEKLVLERLLSIAQKRGFCFRILLGPRHPARFDEVFDLIQAMNLPVIRLSEGVCFKEEKAPLSVLLVDRMGFLNYCYNLSDACLVAGSWADHVGGHNILEPVLQGVPSLCGPYVYKQKDVWQLASQYDLVKKVSLEAIEEPLVDFLENKDRLVEWNRQYKIFKAECQGSVLRCYNLLVSM